MINVRAIDAFIASKSRIDAAIARLSATSEDHFGISPDDVTWGDASLYADVARRLNRICDQVFCEGEYSPDTEKSE